MEIDFLKYCTEEDVLINNKLKNKKQAISAMLDLLIKNKKIDKKHKGPILKAIMQREEMGSTAIGGNIALPHTRVSYIKNIAICFLISSQGVDFNALDEEPVYIVVLLISNQKEAGLHLKTLAFLAKMLKDKLFIQRLKELTSKSQIYQLIKKQAKLLI